MKCIQEKNRLWILFPTMSTTCYRKVYFSPINYLFWQTSVFGREMGEILIKVRGVMKSDPYSPIIFGKV